jgi:hypothetical protein
VFDSRRLHHLNLKIPSDVDRLCRSVSLALTICAALDDVRHARRSRQHE